MKKPTWRIAVAIQNQAKEPGGYARLAEKINQLESNARLPRLDRRKLTAIATGADFTVSTGELVAIDNFFSPLGEGFGDHPLFPKHTLLETMAENTRLEVLVGAFQRNTDERNDVSLWDVKAFQEVLSGLQKYTEAFRFNIRDIPFFDVDAKHNQNDKTVRASMLKPNTSLCAVGSTRANVASEVVLAGMFGVSPFCPPMTRLPFKFFWPGDDVRTKGGFLSAFEATEEELARVDPRTVQPSKEGRRSSGLLLEDQGLLVEPKKKGRWYDYGIFAAQRLTHYRVHVVLAGVTGPSTLAAAFACRMAKDLQVPEKPSQGRSAVLWGVVKATISGGHTGIGDIRKVEDFEVMGEPKTWSVAP